MFLCDVCIVGAGLIGTAAAKYISSNGRLKVCLIGPEEPKNPSLARNRDIFGEHYDEGRLTRLIQANSVWTKLAERSVNEYRNIEKESGIHFYEEVGNLTVLKTGTDELCENQKNAKENKIDYIALEDKEAFRRHFPFFNFADNDYGMFEKTTAGHISPRKLLAAQTVIASNNGCDIIRDVVKEVDRVQHPDGSSIMKLITDSGAEVHARKVLLSTGSFTQCRHLLPSGVDLEYQHIPLMVTLVEISEKDASKLRNMPAVVYNGDGAKDWKIDQDFGAKRIEFYLLPPIQYPDGKYYIKLGFRKYHHYTGHRMTREEIQKWFVGKGNNPVIARVGKELITSTVKGIELLSYHPDSCVFVLTPSRLPYIGWIHSNLAIVLGDNGSSAKSSNEIGRIAAQLVSSEGWDYDIPSNTFEIKYRTNKTAKL